MDEIWLVMTNAPDRKTARKIAALLVDRKLAACVNIVGACESVYRWEGMVETAREVQIQIKTMAETGATRGDFTGSSMSVPPRQCA